MRDLHQQPIPTPESIWAILQETNRIVQETAQLQKENERKYEQERKEYNRRMAEMNKKVEGISDTQGLFAEEYFFNSFYEGKKDFFGMNFKDITKNLKLNSRTIDIDLPQTLEDEYDIVMYGDGYAAIIEVKFKVRQEAIDQVLKKAETFKILSPKYRNAKIYLGLASLVFPKNMEEKCLREGIAIIKQIGDMVIINDKHLKVF